MARDRDRSKDCTSDEVESLVRNTELFIEGARVSLRQLRRVLRDPAVLADRVERVKASAMDNVAKALEAISEFERDRHGDDDR